MLDSYYTVRLLQPRKRKPRPKVGDLTLAEVVTLQALDLAIRQYANPSFAEIVECSHNRIKFPSMVHKYLHRLADKGYVSLPPRGRARGVKMLRPVPLQPR